MIKKLQEENSITELISKTTIKDINDGILKNIVLTVNEINDSGIYIFGIGKLGKKIFDFCKKNNIKVNGFIDNNEKNRINLFNNLPVLSLNNINNNALIYIASITYLDLISKQLIENGFNKIINHFQAGILFSEYLDFPSEMYQTSITEDLIENKDKYIEIYNFLEDDESRRIFRNIISYRLTFNQIYIDSIQSNYTLQYFDTTAVNFTNEEVFYDIGAFDGDSSLAFINHVNNVFKRIHIFEPDVDLLNKAKLKLANYKNVVYNLLGVFNENTTLYFDTTGGLDGSISEIGTVAIKTTSIDSYVDEVPTYIKMDIEGVELEALEGASQTIKKCQPKLAVASYHYPDHLWKVPLYIKNLNPNYKIKLRHYTNSIFETIFYFY